MEVESLTTGIAAACSLCFRNTSSNCAAYLSEDALNDNYSFSESGIYKQPQETNIDGYRGIIDRFPDFEKPEVFGMNENANITFKLTESKMALSTILSIQPRDTGGSSDDSEQQTAKTPDQ